MNNGKKDNLEISILNYIEEAEREYKDLSVKQDKIVDSLNDLRNTMKNLKETLQYHRKKSGKSVRTVGFSNIGRFSNIKNLAEASAKIIEEQKEVDTKHIVESLKMGGFKFETKQPGRSIFFAVYRHPNIIKTETGSYKWVETKEGEENK